LKYRDFCGAYKYYSAMRKTAYHLNKMYGTNIYTFSELDKVISVSPDFTDCKLLITEFGLSINLKTINMIDNQIPTEFGDLINLEEVNQISTELGDLINSREINIETSFIKPISSEICHLINIKKID
jgi:hypothetical protein